MPVKIDRQTAEHIRDLVRSGMTQKEVGYQVGLSKAAISMIIANKVWKDAEDERSEAGHLHPMVPHGG